MIMTHFYLSFSLGTFSFFSECGRICTRVGTVNGIISGWGFLFLIIQFLNLLSFRVQNMRADCEYRFSFVNFSKPDSQYSVGMKPVLYSEMEAQQSGVGWMRVGSEMTYFKDCRSSDDPDRPSQYVMSFTLTFPHANDTVYLAHCYPYKYTDLIQDLNNIRNDHQRSKCFKQTVLCQTLAGNDVPLVTITSPNTAADMKYKQGQFPVNEYKIAFWMLRFSH